MSASKSIRSWLAEKRPQLTAVMSGSDTQAKIDFLAEVFEKIRTCDETACMEIARWLSGEKELVARDARVASRLRIDCGSLGSRTYHSGQMARAAAFYSLTAAYGNANNYAYMLRRGEVPGYEGYPRLRLLEMLREDVSRRSVFPMTNLALLLIQGGTEAEWSLAERIFRILPESEVHWVKQWWLDLARADDPEGFLVLFMLQQAGKIPEDQDISRKMLAWYLMQEMLGFPARYHQGGKVDVEDVMQVSDDRLKDCCLRVYFRKVPRNYATSRKLLTAIGKYPDKRLYRVLMDELPGFLTTQEAAKLRKEYARRFGGEA